MLKRVLTKENIFTLVFVIVALHPIIELDYLWGVFFDDIGIPRITTIIDFVILPLLVLFTFILCEKNKKKVLLVFGIYALLFGVYFVIHSKNASVIQTAIHLTDNFYFSIVDEIFYTLTLLIPLVYIYLFYKSELSESTFKKIIICTSCVISLPIMISNIFLFGKSTYSGYTIENIFSWFSLPFDMFDHHPRYYATKFFFEEGNTIGILMIMVLPFLYYFFNKDRNTKNRVFIGLLIFVHSISMVIISTRIATYGSALIPIVMLVIYLVLCFINKDKIDKLYVLLIVVMTCVCGTIIPYGPAYQNQLIDASDYEFVKNEEHQRVEAASLLKDGEGLEKWSEEWRNFYVFMFEDYQFLMNVTPPIYYTTWYNYEYDPEFWVDLIFDYELEERVNGRQIESIFTKYKWEELNNTQKLTGFGYGTFMRGGIIIERDFVQQFYSYGPVGFALLMGPWIVLLVYCGIRLLLGCTKGKWTYFNIILLMSAGIGFVASYMSGHTFDELTTSLFISLCIGALLKVLRNEKVK